MPSNIIAEWEGYEYEHSPKSADWYWALGIVAIAGIISALLFSNILLAVLIGIAVITIALHTTKHPPLHRFLLTEKGLMIGDDFHPFERMLSFSVLEDIAGEFPPTLSIKTESWHSPHLMIPLNGVDADRVYAHLLERVKEGEHVHTVSDLVAAWFGF